MLRSRNSLTSYHKKMIESHIQAILQHIGEDPQREGLVKTPARVAKALAEVTTGYHQDACEILRSAIFDATDSQGLVLVRDIPFYSLCEHHILPFFGQVHIAYLPGSHITGLSKLARTVEVFARRLQVQERLTRQIAEAIMEALDAQGVVVVVEAQHMCMQMRGVEKPGTVTTTVAALGCYENDVPRRQEVLTLIRK